ncbi:serine--tRNA ligase [Candidatus Woesearchaeota archaeon]|nr:serine--tRNA ligase [Candidatus Woesearchaeota archaeon]
MLDIKVIRENPSLVKESQRKRGMDEGVVDMMLALDKKWKVLKQEVDELRAERNRLSAQINAAKKEGKETSQLLQRAKEIPLLLEQKEKESNALDRERHTVLESIPNLIDASVPVGDATKNHILEVIGEPKKFSFPAKGHEELLTPLDAIDTERAAKVAGARFYYLKREIVTLNFSLMMFALDFLKKKGFTLVQPPYMLNRKALNGAITLAAFEEMIYKIEGEDLYMIGTAEHALNAYYMDDVLKELPVHFAGVSPCFRKEAGSHGKDTKGIFRAHQFEKIEQFTFCKPEDAWTEFDLLLSNSRELLTLLEIPFRFVALASGDTGRVPTKTIDFEGWFPSQQAYRELGSCSNCLDYQARRSNIRYEDKGERNCVYTLNNTAIATERMIACLVENNQQKDGAIIIPKALQKYAGFKKIPAAKK